MNHPLIPDDFRASANALITAAMSVEGIRGARIFAEVGATFSGALLAEFTIDGPADHEASCVLAALEAIRAVVPAWVSVRIGGVMGSL